MRETGLAKNCYSEDCSRTTPSPRTVALLVNGVNSLVTRIDLALTGDAEPRWDLLASHEGRVLGKRAGLPGRVTARS